MTINFTQNTFFYYWSQHVTFLYFIPCHDSDCHAYVHLRTKTGIRSRSHSAIYKARSFNILLSADRAPFRYQVERIVLLDRLDAMTDVTESYGQNQSTPVDLISHRTCSYLPVRIPLRLVTVESRAIHNITWSTWLVVDEFTQMMLLTVTGDRNGTKGRMQHDH